MDFCWDERDGGCYIRLIAHVFSSDEDKVGFKLVTIGLKLLGNPCYLGDY